MAAHTSTRPDVCESDVDSGGRTIDLPSSLSPEPSSRGFSALDNGENAVDEAVASDTSECNLFIPIEMNSSSESGKKRSNLDGMRMVDLGYFLQELTKLSNHNPVFSCTLGNMHFVREIHMGFSSTLVFHCNMCNNDFSLRTEDPIKSSTHLDVNTRAVSGIMSIGGGFSHLEEFFSSVGIPCMSSKTYSKLHNKVCNAWEKAALRQMEDAVKEEAALALERGDVDENGTPLLTVVADGCWSKRSYRCQYNALSGVAAIVGYYTKKVLHMGVRNKFCFVCARSSDENIKLDHECFKNWTESSSSMEANIIVEGFKQSETEYGVIYSHLIADGDSSCYAKILQARPYRNVTVEKIECRNHLLRNFCAKLKSVAEQTKVGGKPLRKLIGSKVLKLRVAVRKAIKHRKNEILSNVDKIALLRTDILNSPSHVFGEHKSCAGYFCSDSKPGDVNRIPELKESGLYEEIMKPVGYLANHSRSLIFDVDSNSVEQFNSIVAKFVGGKRINFSMRRSYQGRCAAAVVSHNTKKPHSILHKSMCNNISPNCYIKRLENRRSTQRERVHAARKKHCRKRLLGYENRSATEKQGNKDYGPECQKPDMSPEVYDQEQDRTLRSLIKTEEERRSIEKATILQAGSGQWLEQRRKMLTASNFGKVCRRRASTSCRNLVKSIMYSRDLMHVSAISYGRNNEATALLQLERQENIRIEKCGLFIDEKLHFLGATPDGLVDVDKIVEIKCPISAAGVNPEKAVFEGKIKYLTCNKEKTHITGINKNHVYFYQIQGQLHITKRDICILAVWTSVDQKLLTVQIKRDEKFWNEKMEPKLTNFFFECMLPELVDPRHLRNMEIRDPSCLPSVADKLYEKE